MNPTTHNMDDKQHQVKSRLGDKFMTLQKYTTLLPDKSHFMGEHHNPFLSIDEKVSSLLNVKNVSPLFQSRTCYDDGAEISPKVNKSPTSFDNEQECLEMNDIKSLNGQANELTNDLECYDQVPYECYNEISQNSKSDNEIFPEIKNDDEIPQDLKYGQEQHDNTQDEKLINLEYELDSKDSAKEFFDRGIRFVNRPSF